ncbi:MAG: hypothetical protein N3B13_02305, partial [Deltaproteobacteria bacterium]|nr:hypothetical protein [Deltaproteobacteria bacterium]
KALFGLRDNNCELRPEKRVKSGELSVWTYKKYCKGIEVYNERLNVFLNRETLFGIRNGIFNADDSKYEFNISEYEAAEKLKSEGLISDYLSAKRILFRFGTKLLPVCLIRGYEKVFLRSYLYFADASDGRLLFKIPLWWSAKGNVYIDSPEKDKNVSSVDLPDTTEYGVLKNVVADVFSDCDPASNCDISKRLARPDNGGNYLFLPDETDSSDPFAEVMAYYHLNRLYNWFQGSGFEFNPFGVTAVVNFLGVGSEYDELFQCNGFYTERQVVIGFCPKGNPNNTSGVNLNIAYDADVLMHEMTHGFYDELYKLYPVIASMGYSGLLYGLNEALADFIPAHITNDPHTGRHLGKAIKKESIRNLELVRKCPDFLKGESHDDGEIISTALWNARKTIQDRELFAKTVFLSLSGLDTSSTFKDFYENLLRFVSQAAGQGEADRIKKPFLDRNIDRCGRFIEVENGFTAEGYILPSAEIGVSNEVPYQVQFVYSLPEDNGVVNVDITAVNFAGSTNTDYVKFYVNHNRPVSYSFESLNTDYVWTKRMQTFTDLKAGKYYILPAGDGQGYYYFKFRFAYKEPAPVVDSVEPNEIKINSTVEELTISGQNFHSDAKIKLPYGITYEDYEVYNSSTIYVYNLKVSDEVQCGYTSVSVINPDGQRGHGKSLLLIVKGNEKCRCDITFDCDEACKCDPDCSDGGCGCSIIY